MEIFILDGILGDFFRKVSDCAAGLRVEKNQKSDHAESCHYAETNNSLKRQVSKLEQNIATYCRCTGRCSGA